MIRLSSAIAIAGLALFSPFIGASPLMTVLHQGAVDPGAPAAAAMLQGFTACNPVEALPRTLFEQNGVKFISADAAAGVALAGNGLRDRRYLVLAPKPKQSEINGDQRYETIGASYRLSRPVQIAPNVRIVAVGQSVSFQTGLRPFLTVAYTFDSPISKVRPILEGLAGKALRNTLDFSRATPDQVGFEFDEDAGLDSAHTLNCIRLPE